MDAASLVLVANIADLSKAVHDIEIESHRPVTHRTLMDMHQRLFSCGVDLTDIMSRTLALALSECKRLIPVTLLIDSSALARLHSQVKSLCERASKYGHTWTHIKTIPDDEMPPEAFSALAMAMSSYPGTYLKPEELCSFDPHDKAAQSIPLFLHYGLKMSQTEHRLVVVSADTEIRKGSMALGLETFTDHPDILETLALPLLLEVRILASTRSSTTLEFLSQVKYTATPCVATSAGRIHVSESNIEEVLDVLSAQKRPGLDVVKDKDLRSFTHAVSLGMPPVSSLGMSTSYRQAVESAGLKLLEQIDPGSCISLSEVVRLPHSGASRTTPFYREVTGDRAKTAVQQYTISTTGVSPVYHTVRNNNWHTTTLIMGLGWFRGRDCAKETEAEVSCAEVVCKYLYRRGIVFPSLV